MNRFNHRFIVLFLGTVLLLSSFTLKADAEIIPTTREPVFDADYYAKTNPDVVEMVGEDEVDLCEHYLFTGKAEGLLPYEGAKLSPIISRGDDYRILAVGNSITIHPPCDYWWNYCGMAASRPEKDYIHTLVNYLENDYSNVHFDIVSYSYWEEDTERSLLLPNLDQALRHNYDLIIIQLGENVNSTKRFSKDFKNLVSYIKQDFSDSQIIIIGDYWYLDGRDNIKKNVARELDCDYVNLKNIKCNTDYKANEGDSVLGLNNKWHKIDNYDVARHPNDLGMEYIADKIYEVIEKKDSKNEYDSFDNNKYDESDSNEKHESNHTSKSDDSVELHRDDDSEELRRDVGSEELRRDVGSEELRGDDGYNKF